MSKKKKKDKIKINKVLPKKKTVGFMEKLVF